MKLVFESYKPSLSLSFSLCLLNDLKERERKKQGVAERVREGVGVAERGGENYQLLLAGKAGFDKKS